MVNRPGINVDTAWGAIRVDTSQLVRDRQMVATEATAMRRSLEQAGQGARAFASSLASGMQMGLSALGGLSAASVAAAQSVRGLQVQFRVLTGSETEAVRMLADLREMADRTGQPFLELAENAASLIPSLRGTNTELSTVLGISQRLKLLDLTARTFDMAIAIREFISGEYLSLSRRFELSRDRLRTITEEAGGDVNLAMQGLSAYLDELGITQGALEEMGQSGVNAFAVMRSEITELLAEAGMPFLEDFVLPVVQGISSMTRTVRELNPELLQMAVTLGGVFGTGAILRTLGIRLGVAGLGTAAAAVAGAGVGAIGAQELSRQGVGDPRLAEMKTGDVLRVAVATFVTAIGKAGEALTELHFVFRAIGIQIRATIASATESVGHFITNLAIFLSRLGMDTSGMAMTGVGVVTSASRTLAGIPDETAALAREREEALAGARAWTAEMAELGVSLVGGKSALATFRGEVAATGEVAQEAASNLQAGGTAAFSPEQVEAFSLFREDLQNIRNQAAEQIAEENENYASLRQQAMANAASQRAELDAEWAGNEREHAARLNEIRAAAHKEALRSEQDYQRQRLQNMAAHSFNLLKAAARLDAEAIWEENRRYRMEQDAQDERRRDEQQRIQEQLSERLAQENATFVKERQMYERRKADIETQLQEQLRSYEDQHRERLAQINRQMNQELTTREQAFIREFNQLATHENQKLQIQREGQAKMAHELQLWWSQMSASLGMKASLATGTAGKGYASATTTTSTSKTLGGYTGSSFVISGGTSKTGGGSYLSYGGDVIRLTPYQAGGRVLATGPAWLHAGEEVLRPEIAHTLRGLMGGGVNQEALLRLAGGRSVNWNGDINIMQPGATAEQIRQVLLDTLLEVAG